MPIFYFHHHSPDSTLRDDMGCRFASLELAYLDAYRSMVEIGVELIKRQENPSRHLIEITDAGGRALMELHFSDVFRGRGGTRYRELQAIAELRERIARSRQLRDDLRQMCVTVRASVERAHAMLARAKSTV